ncbi:hypothetical protein LMTR13_08755 [Bradyrhizobium icense]|uniref:Uncharacterized protein n=1 Tax=Bradyrhizobium icense TaxID=1274631 RepID=A0A1B1UBU8_9BRAD|nr:hypothetical protein LMTR13_08755 [Bradyrhizobium icense]
MMTTVRGAARMTPSAPKAEIPRKMRAAGYLHCTLLNDRSDEVALELLNDENGAHSPQHDVKI